MDYFVLCLALRQRPADGYVQACTLRRYRIAYPATLETILRAEGAFFPNLEASGTLQSASFVRTFDAHAGLLDGHFRSHDGSDVQREANEYYCYMWNHSKSESLVSEVAASLARFTSLAVLNAAAANPLRMNITRS